MSLAELLASLVDASQSGRRVVETVLLETRGSTPQKAGARMLVFADGSQQGTLGGGCVEAEIKRAALEALHLDQPRIMSFVLDHDYGWDDGLICGGRMTALIQPADGRTLDYHGRFLNLLQQGQGLTEALSLSEESRPPQRYLLDHAGDTIATLHGSGLPTATRESVRPLSSRPQPYAAAGFGFLPELPVCRLVIVGAGHVGRALARYAHDLEFHVTVVDDRAEYCNSANIPQADAHLVGRYDEVLPSLGVEAGTCCVIVTRGHNHDEEALLHLIRKQPGYLGMIGSRRKIKLIFDDLLRQGIPEEQLSRVHAPIGIDIGSRTVAEIAISIAAQLVQYRHYGATSDGCQDSQCLPLEGGRSGTSTALDR